MMSRWFYRTIGGAMIGVSLFVLCSCSNSTNTSETATRDTRPYVQKQSAALSIVLVDSAPKPRIQIELTNTGTEPIRVDRELVVGVNLYVWTGIQRARDLHGDEQRRDIKHIAGEMLEASSYRKSKERFIDVAPGMCIRRSLS